MAIKIQGNTIIDDSRVLINTGNIGVGTTNPTAAVDANNTTIVNAGIVTANFLYGDGSNITGLTAGDVGAIAGITIREEGSIVGSAGSVQDISFVGSNLTATSGAGSSLATVTLTDNPTFDGVTVTGVVTAASFVGNGSNLTGINSFAAELRQDVDGNLFAGDSTTGGGYDPVTGTACFNIFMGCNAGNSITEGDFNFFAGCSAGSNNTTGSCNNFLGRSAGQSNTTGGNNNFFGNNAGKCNTTGTNNNFLGAYAGRCNTTGTYNNFIGLCAGFNNTTGGNNNFLGNSAGKCNTTGSSNNFLGALAGFCNTTGVHNNFFGCNAGYNNTTGGFNNFLGNSAGFCNTTGAFNNFLGTAAGKCNTTGGYNNFLGNSAGFNNTTGGNNNFLGREAGRFNTTGSNNFFVGYVAGRNNTTGTYNNFLGNSAGKCNTTGGNNNFLGTYAGYANTTGTNNNFFGCGAGCNNTTGSNNIAFGFNAGQTSGSPSGLINLTTSDNCIVMGNANHSCAAIQIAWTVISDIRDKCVYGDVPHGRGFLQNINPIKYSFKNRETNEVTDERVRYGFSAQEVAELEGDETIIASKSNIDKWGVTHEHLLPVLVNAIKELDAENQELKERLSSLEEKVNSLLNN